MANKFKRLEILQSLYTMMCDVVSSVYTTKRPTVKESSDSFAVIRLPQGIDAVSEIHNTCYAQIQLFYKDRSNGVENVPSGEQLLDSTLSLIERDLSAGGRFGYFLTCNHEPQVYNFDSDLMGYNVIVVQFKLTINFIKQ